MSRPHSAAVSQLTPYSPTPTGARRPNQHRAHSDTHERHTSLVRISEDGAHQPAQRRRARLPPAAGVLWPTSPPSPPLRRSPESTPDFLGNQSALLPGAAAEQIHHDGLVRAQAAASSGKGAGVLCGDVALPIDVQLAQTTEDAQPPLGVARQQPAQPAAGRVGGQSAECLDDALGLRTSRARPMSQVRHGL